MQRGSNGLATRTEWFGHADRMVWQREPNGLATQIEWFGNANRRVWQREPNGLATQIEWFGNADRISLVPRPPPFFVLRFAFSIIHGSGKRGRPGLIHHVCDVRWTRGERRGEGHNRKYMFAPTHSGTGLSVVIMWWPGLHFPLDNQPCNHQ